MATGGSSIYKGSDLIHDYSCFKCEEDAFNTEAQHFCPQCEHYLCDKCVNMHNGYHKKHTVYGRGEIRKWAGVSMDRCDQHGNKLEVHCDDHQELCCSVCVALNHRMCSSINHLPDLAKGFLLTAELNQLAAAVDKMMSSLDELKNIGMKDQTSLNVSYKKIIAEIKALRRDINQILDQLEKKTIEQLDSLMKELEKNVKDDLDTCADMHDRLKTMIDKLQQVTGKQKEINSYIGFRKCQTQLNEATSLVQEIQRRPKEWIRFKSGEHVLSYLRDLKSLGNVDSVHVYRAQSSAGYSVKMKNEYECYIVGICELPNGEVVIADYNNNNVKLLNRQFKVTAHFDLDLAARPEHLCHTDGNEIVVVCGDLHRVYFLSVNIGQIQAGRNFTTNDKCYSIAHNQGQLYVGSRNALYQYTIDGLLIKKIYEDISVNRTVHMCAVSPDGERIYVTNSAKHEIVTLDKGRQVVSTFQDPELKWPNGLCVCPTGDVFVCGQESCTVLQIDREGRQKLAIVARGDDGFTRPRLLCFSEQTSSLIVGSYTSNEVTVVKLF